MSNEIDLSVGELKESNKFEKYAIEVENLVKIYDGRIRALDGLSFKIKKGEIFGFLGPNGAGKTTTIMILSTLLHKTDGGGTVNGFDVSKEPDNVRRSIGVVFQEVALDLQLTGYENLRLHANLHGLTKKSAENRINEVLTLVNLQEQKDWPVERYSGGMKRRLEIARGLLHAPSILFLDEPTLGLDPQTRRSIWNYIRMLNTQTNITILLTTHYMEEADELCDKIAIIDKGKLIAEGTPDKLKSSLGGDVIMLELANADDMKKMKKLVKNLPYVKKVKKLKGNGKEIDIPSDSMMNVMMQAHAAMKESSKKKGKHEIPKFTPQQMPGNRPHGMLPFGITEISKKLALVVENGGQHIPELINIAKENGIEIVSVENHKPTLEDVFLNYTGKRIREETSNLMEGIKQMMMMRARRQ